MESKRRTFLKTTSLAIAGAILSPKLLMSEPKEDRQVMADVALRRRKNFSKLTPNDPDIQLYKKAVQVMKARPASDPKSWAAQANIHLNFCPHGNWFFLPWHRAYLKYFEAVCREACGDSSFNLPYWNWTDYTQIPAAFWDINSPLYDKTRKITQNDNARAESIGPLVITRVLGQTSFEDFASYRADSPRDRINGGQGLLEATPHNHIHMFIRGNMGTALSPLDPIFWLHHANIDRIWATWNDNGNANSQNLNFNNYVLKQNFFDPEKNALVDVRVGDLFDVRDSGYLYDSQQGQTPTVMKNSTFNFIAQAKSGIKNNLQAKKFNALSLEIIASQVISPDILTTLESGKIEESKKRVKVLISEIEPPEKEDFFVRVFLNCDYLGKDTPINDPHYVGTFSFFASKHEHTAEGDHHNMHHDQHNMSTKKVKFVLDITETLSKVADVATIDFIKDKIKVQLLPVPLDGISELSFLPGKVEIAVTEVAP